MEFQFHLARSRKRPRKLGDSDGTFEYVGLGSSFFVSDLVFQGFFDFIVLSVVIFHNLRSSFSFFLFDIDLALF